MDALLVNFARRDQLKPICELGRNDFERLLECASVFEFEPRTLISNENNTLVYLLDGEVSLLSGGIIVEQFIHSDPRALLPLFDVIQREDTALMNSPGVILEIDYGLFEALYAQCLASSGHDNVVNLAQDETRLFDHLLAAFQQGRIPLPSLSDAALKIRQVINRPSIGTQEIIQIVQTDPGLSARLIKVANSALYGTWREINTVRDAVRRLGLENTRNLSFGLSVKQMFNASTMLIRQQVQRAYDESVGVSALAFVIATHRADHLDPEQALLAGLVQNLGVIPILKYIDENPKLVSNLRVLEKSLINLRIPISSLLLKQWNFGADFMIVVDQADNWNRDTGLKADYADIVIAARIIYLHQTGQLDENLDFELLPLMKKLNLVEVDSRGRYFFDKAQDEINAMQQILRS